MGSMSCDCTVSVIATPMTKGVFVTLFVSNNLIGWIGRFYEQMSPAAFWALHAAIGATGGMLVLLFGRPLGRALKSDSSSP